MSGILQEAVAERLAQLERLDALAVAVGSYEAEFGAFSEDDLRAQVERDEPTAVRVRSKRTRSSVA